MENRASVVTERSLRTPRRGAASRYRLDSRVATSATTSVWRATDLIGRRPVAVKQLKARAAADDTVRARFATEIHISSAMLHPSVLQVLDADGDSQRPYLVTEWVEGESLETVLRRGHLPPSTAIRIAGALARALSHVHGRGAIHCDVKPANILVRNDGQVRLADFGIATPIGARHDGTVFGSIHYMSPERLVGRGPSPACDVYALGVTLYEMIAGRRPFTGSSPLEVALAHRRNNSLAHPAFGRIPASVDAVLRTALAQDPHERYRSAGFFAMELESAGRQLERQVIAG